MCPICNVTGGAKHHYHCPYDKEFKNTIVERGEHQHEPTKPYDYKFGIYGGWLTTKRHDENT